MLTLSVPPLFTFDPLMSVCAAVCLLAGIGIAAFSALVGASYASYPSADNALRRRRAALLALLRLLAGVGVLVGIVGLYVGL